MNAKAARSTARAKAGVGQPLSERMKAWLERRWAELEEATNDPFYALKEEEFLKRLKQYEVQCRKEMEGA